MDYRICMKPKTKKLDVKISALHLSLMNSAWPILTAIGVRHSDPLQERNCWKDHNVLRASNAVPLGSTTTFKLRTWEHVILVRDCQWQRRRGWQGADNVGSCRPQKGLWILLCMRCTAQGSLWRGERWSDLHFNLQRLFDCYVENGVWIGKADHPQDLCSGNFFCWMLVLQTSASLIPIFLRNWFQSCSYFQRRCTLPPFDFLLFGMWHLECVLTYQFSNVLESLCSTYT